MLVETALRRIEALDQEPGLAAGSDEHASRWLSISEQCLDELERLPTEEFQVERECLDSRTVPFVMGIALSGAIHSVRSADPDLLKLGVRALLFEGASDDWRETMICFGLLRHSAAKLGVEFAAVVQAAVLPRHGEVADMLLAALKTPRPPLADWRYEESEDRHGRFTYKYLR